MFDAPILHGSILVITGDGRICLFFFFNISANMILIQGRWYFNILFDRVHGGMYNVHILRHFLHMFMKVYFC